MNDEMQALIAQTTGMRETTEQDATATQAEEVIETPEQEPTHKEDNSPAEESEQIATEVENEEATIDYKAEFEKMEQRYKDLQSHNDKRFNDLQKQQNVEKPATEEPAPAEVDYKALEDLMYENPQEFIKQVLQKQAPTQQIDQDAIRRQIQEDMIKAEKPDYDEAIGLVKHAASVNPKIQEEIFASSNPALTAYQKGLELKESQEILSNPQAYKEKLRAELTAELSATKPKTRTLNNVNQASKTSAPESRKSLLDTVFKGR